MLCAYQTGQARLVESVIQPAADEASTSSQAEAEADVGRIHKYLSRLKEVQCFVSRSGHGRVHCHGSCIGSGRLEAAGIHMEVSCLTALGVIRSVLLSWALQGELQQLSSHSGPGLCTV